VKKASAFALLALAPLAWFSSCATAGKSARVKLDTQSKRLIEAARYREAIDLYKSARRDYPKDNSIAADYARTLDRIFGVAGAAMARGDFATAEGIYLVLVRGAPDFSGIAPPPSFTRASLDAGLKSSRIAICVQRTRLNIRTGEFRKAIQGLRDLIKAFTRDPEASAKAVGGLENILAAADEATAKADFARGGVAYYSLWKSYPLFPGAEKSVSFNRERLDAGLSECRTAMTRQGLEHYRKGELSAAISVWRSLLLFDPENGQIKKSIESASAQLKKIKS
jgi:tetratricopeptide (TPR) repeat protein